MFELAQNIAEAFMGFTSASAPDVLAGQALTICTHLVLWLGFALVVSIMIGLFRLIGGSLAR